LLRPIIADIETIDLTLAATCLNLRIVSTPGPLEASSHKDCLIRFPPRFKYSSGSLRREHKLSANAMALALYERARLGAALSLLAL
jgi:hypothetical protein